MPLLVAGLVLFLGVHLMPTSVSLRARLVARLGAHAYRGAFALVAGLGLALIVAGYWRADRGPQLFAPWPAAVRLAPAVVTLAFILLAASHTPSHLRAAVRHPMLLGVIAWSLVHLLANGDARGTLLFGAFAAWALVDLVSLVTRESARAFTPRWRADAVSVIAGLVLALVVMTFHRVLFGPQVVPWGV
jgi:uncharacterized membrane protein